MKLNEAIADWWLRNARIRHGHPPNETPVTIDQPAGQPSGLSTAAKVALGVLAGGAAAAAVPAVSSWVTGDRDQPAPTEPAEPAGDDGSLYQYLEDNGYHLQ